MFADSALRRVFDHGITGGVIGAFILVAANYGTPIVGSFYENSSTSGRWMEFTTGELLPFIDRSFRTIPRRDSRGLAGEFIGGYGALRFAVFHPELFGSVCALHPVGTGAGEIPMPVNTRQDRASIHRAEPSPIWPETGSPKCSSRGPRLFCPIRSGHRSTATSSSN